MTIASAVAALEAEFQVTENNIVTWINQAWLEVEAVESWVDNELSTIASWIAAHQTDINALFSTALAETALAAAGAASSALAAGLTAGSTPASTISNAYTAVKAASSAVNAVLQKAAAPTATPAT
jgi:hypothetical protein